MAIKAIIAFSLLASLSFAQTWQTGSLDIGTKERPFVVKVFLTDSYTTKEISNRNANSYSETTLYGQYASFNDGSPGSITLNANVSFKEMAMTFTHELCHARQDQQRRAYNETECYKREGYR